jgi:GNAT superfamily N-acetyltransferase
MEHGLRKAVQRTGIQPAKIKNVVGMIRRATPAKIVRHIRNWTWRRREFRVYRMTAADIAKTALPSSEFKQDCVSDLLCFDDSESWLTRQKFLSAALERMGESGQHFFTRVVNGKLSHYGWLLERQRESFFTEVKQHYTFPENSAVLYDFYTAPSARGKGIYSKSIRNILAHVAQIPGTEYAFISVLADNRPSRHVIEKTGFSYVESISLQVRLGREQVSRSANHAAVPVSPAAVSAEKAIESDSTQVTRC